MIRLVAALFLLTTNLTYAQGLPTVYHPTSTPDAEFAAAPAVRVLPGETVAELSGSFSEAVAPALEQVLLRTPSVQTIRFESPGGDVAAALAVAQILRSRGLDSYVGRECNSACTLAFLGGQHRYLADGARLGFHQASSPGIAPSRLDALMREAYAQQGVPNSFIDHVLRTPPDAAWFPSARDLQNAGFRSGPAPAALAIPDDAVSAAWVQALPVLRWASDATFVHFSQALIPLLAALDTHDAGACWGFMHGTPIELSGVVRGPMLEDMAAALRQIQDDVQGAPAVGISSVERARLREALGADALRQDADYCRALRSTVAAALAMPASIRGPALRALLAAQ